MITLLILVLLQSMPVSDNACTYDDACGQGMCRVWEHSRFVCEPKQYGVAVWDHECIDKVEVAAQSKVEAPLDGDAQPRRSEAKLTGAIVTFKQGCTWHIEIRSR